jgi:hypothetical protein
MLKVEILADGMEPCRRNLALLSEVGLRDHLEAWEVVSRPETSDPFEVVVALASLEEAVLSILVEAPFLACVEEVPSELRASEAVLCPVTAAVPWLPYQASQGLASMIHPMPPLV